MSKTDPFTLSLLTNDEVLAVNQHGENNRQLFRTADGLVALIADVPGGVGDKYLAVFNTRDAAKDEPKDATIPVLVKLADIGFTGSANVRDLWTEKNIGSMSDEFVPQVPFHGARLFRLKAGR